jgi:hypothetical protein
MCGCAAELQKKVKRQNAKGKGQKYGWRIHCLSCMRSTNMRSTKPATGGGLKCCEVVSVDGAHTSKAMYAPPVGASGSAKGLYPSFKTASDET